MKRLFGTLPDGEKIYLYTIKSKDTSAEILTYGAVLRSLCFCGTDVVGGFDNIESYITNPGNQGGIIGRVANRIEKASFVMDGQEYHLKKNDGEHCLHGGVAFNHAVWRAEEYSESHVTLTYLSPDGEAGFPGNLFTEVTYTLDGNSLIIDYKAMTDSISPIALTNHAYFNLDGFGGDVMDHTLKIFADRYTEIDSNIIPTGNRPSVDGTNFDFRAGKRLGDAFCEGFRGYDHNFILSPKTYKSFIGKSLGLAAELENDKLRLSVYTDQPGLQLYTGNGLSGDPDFKGGVKAIRHGALCLETQTEPNATKRGEGFYVTGEIYTHTSVYMLERK